MSSSMALRRSPKPCALTAATLSPPRSLLTTSVASASPSTSSATISSGLPLCTTASSTGSMACKPDSFFSWIRMYGFSSSAIIFSALVTKYGERYPRSNCIPSTTSSSVSRLFASSTVMTPSLPTFCIASAIILPISWSPLAEIVPTWAISSLVETFLERLFKSPTTASTARSTPRFRSIGFMPAATALAPSRTMECARTVAVVVPSPAFSLVLAATSRTIWAPMFSNLSASSMSLATVTPSLVMRGAPNDLSRTTLRPFGPSVTLTALARMSMPRSIRSRASPLNRTSFAGMGSSSLGRLAFGAALDDSEDVGLLHDHEFLALDLNLAAGPLAEQDPVARLDVQGMELAVLAPGAGANGDHLALHRLLLGSIGNDDASGRLLVLLDPADQDPIM